MSEKTIKSRIIHKHGTAEDWSKATNFIPMQGEFIIYDIDDNYDYERVKVGDGKTVVSDLPFIESSKAEIADKATEADHATSADTATNANHATSADTATEANHATSADSATEADTLDGKHASDFVLTTDFSTLVGDTSVTDQINTAIANYYTKTEIDTYVLVTTDDIDEVCGNELTSGAVTVSDDGYGNLTLRGVNSTGTDGNVEIGGVIDGE